MKNDPDSKRRWEEYNASITSNAANMLEDHDE